MDRRQFVLAGTGLLTALAGCADGETGTPTDTDTSTPTADGTDPGTDEPTEAPTDEPTDEPTETEQEPDLPESVGLETVVSGLELPVGMADVPGTGLRYVVQQGGVARVVEDGSLRETPLFDISDQLSRGYEKGLLGIALHPNFAENRRLFVRYSAPARESTPDGWSHTFVLSEFEAGPDGYTVDTDTEREILTIAQPQGNHNAGSVLFGPDGYLYVGVGDGGAANDQGRGHVEDWYDAVDGGNGQDVTENLLGSILRIDVDGTDGEQAYAIPDDNPLVGEDGLDEQYAWGFRNPWRLSFDGEDLYAGDVGQSEYEEVDLVEMGGNYGWNVKEATHCFQAGDCPDETPPEVRGGEPLLDPVIEYPHGGAPVSGISVITGNVYEGEDVPGLAGWFVFGDLNVAGRLFVARPDGSGLWETRTLPIADGDAGKLEQLFYMDRHEDGLYLLGTGADGGGVFRLGT
ncbi:PQQ-dependent sugar dehydrogenase [Halolamina litorea]|uniref:PQQ-dependent sugar dehydrogenase n=1 Tax=Halolamina litorea TaxID=1515593 RepID=A0ABD6BLI8_9EURY|nr:PQQ-dependent sugar dehydrogenase [Halolamina litorea]